MDKNIEAIADALFKSAEKLSNGSVGHLSVSKETYLKHASGRWRSPETHAEIIRRYNESYSLVADPFALYRIALEHFNVEDFEATEAQLKILDSVKNSYDTTIIWLKLCLKKGLKAEAKAKLEIINDRNKLKGLPKQKLSDFEWP